MFERVVSWWNSLWDKIYAHSCGIWDGAKAAITSAWGTVLIVVGWIWLILNWISDRITQLIAAIDAFAFPDVSVGSTGTLMYYFNLCNTFVPLEELFGFCIAYLGLLAFLNIYKLIKSWIPTFS